jgi:hypothetical protein
MHVAAIIHSPKTELYLPPTGNDGEVGKRHGKISEKEVDSDVLEAIKTVRSK